MPWRCTRWVRAGLAITVFAAALVAADTARLEYDRDVRPILSENCFPCHGQDSKKRMAGLRLDTFEGATADRNGHAALTPGRVESSAVYQRITAGNPAQKMPPPYSNHRLTAEQIAIVRRWIGEGATYSKHWSFIPPRRTELPAVAQRSWVKQPIDAFVLQRLEAEGLRPNGAAAPATWLRRASLVLTGLPPVPADLDRFSAEAQSRGEAAYEAAIDRLLASPSYGERMAMDWLDVARYADTHGFNNDSEPVHVAMARLGDRRLQPQHAVRPIHRSSNWPATCCRIRRSISESRPASTETTHQLGRRDHRGGIPRRICGGPGRTLRHGLARADDGLRALPRPQVRPDHAEGLLPVLRLLQQRAGARRGWACGERRPHDSRANRRPTAASAGIRGGDRGIGAKVDRRRQSAKMNLEVLGRGAVAAPPEGANLYLACESATEFAALAADGVAGQSCVTGDARAKPGVPGERRPGRGGGGRMTFSAWVRPDGEASDGPLLSTMDYATNPASVGYGKGIELRLEGGELEFRWADRFPAYSVRVRSTARRSGRASGHN